MTVLDKSQVLVGTLDQTEAIGAALWAPLGSELPTLENFTEFDFEDKGYVGLGYMPEDGFTVEFGMSTESLKEHNLGKVRNVISEFDSGVELTLMQTNADNMKVMLGDDYVSDSAASATAGNRFLAKFGMHLPKPGVLAVKLKDDDKRSLVLLPCAQVAEYSEVEVTATGNLGWKVKYSAQDDGTGNSIWIFSDDGEVVTGGGN